MLPVNVMLIPVNLTILPVNVMLQVLFAGLFMRLLVRMFAPLVMAVLFGRMVLGVVPLRPVHLLLSLVALGMMAAGMMTAPFLSPPGIGCRGC